ncbi:hypothetical protein ACFFRR_011601 [Megaselia abdita]
MTPSKSEILKERRKTIHENHPTVKQKSFPLDKKCAVSGCKFVEGVNLFRLPIQVIFNQQLSIKWRSILKFDQPLTKNTLLCERHFERKFINTSIFTGKAKLDPTAIPSRTFLNVLSLNVKKEVAVVHTEVKKLKKRKFEFEPLDDQSSSVPPKKSIKLRFFSENDEEHENCEISDSDNDSRSSYDDFSSDESCSSVSSFGSKLKGEHRNCRGNCNHVEEESSSSRYEKTCCPSKDIRTPNLSEDESSSEKVKSLSNGRVFVKQEEPFKKNLNTPLDFNDDNASDVFQTKRPQTPANFSEKFESPSSSSNSSSNSTSELISNIREKGNTKFIIRRVQTTNDETNSTWKIAAPSETESDGSELEVISPSEIGIIPEINSITVETDEDSDESECETKISPSFKISKESAFQKFIDGFIWDADKIKTPKEVESLGSSLVKQINKTRKPNRRVQTVKLKRSCVFYNGRWLRKLKTVKKVKIRKKNKSHKSVQTINPSENRATQVDMRCECNSKMTNVIFETIYPPYFY